MSSGVEERKAWLCYSLGEGLNGRKESVPVRRYFACVTGAESFRDADLQEVVAKEGDGGATVRGGQPVCQRLSRRPRRYGACQPVCQRPVAEAATVRR